MKATAAMMVLLVGMTASSSAALADEASNVQKENAAAFPGGGWDGNNLRISVTHSKLLTQAAFPGGGWDANNLRVSVTRSKLLGPAPVGASACTTVTAPKSN